VARKRILRRALLRIAGLCLALHAIFTALEFPYETDSLADQSGATLAFYRDTYAPRQKGVALEAGAPSAPEDLSRYIQVNRSETVEERIPDQVRAFVETCHLKDKRVLEIGAGSGSLQDIVDDYTALDIAPTARRFFHKPFGRIGDCDAVSRQRL